MTVARVLSWLELAVAAFFIVLVILMFFGLRGSLLQADPHGYIAASGIAFLIMACVFVLGGASLRLSTKWRWLGQVPLAAIVIMMWIFI